VSYRRTSATRPARRGFTLVEIVTSVAISSILLLALTSVVLLASKALPSNVAATDTRDGAAGALDSMLAELATAKSISVASATNIRFTIPDRTGDGADDTIEYKWSGTSGDPLQRNFNDAGWATVSPSLSSFALVYSRRSSTSNVTTTTQIDSGEVTLWNWSGWSGVTPTNSTTPITSSAWANQMFPVSIAQSGINRLEITRISLKLTRQSTSGGVGVSIFNESGTGTGLTSGSIVGSQSTVIASSLPTSAGWVDFAMSGVVFSNSTMGELVVQVAGTSGSSNPATMSFLIAPSAQSGGPVLRWSSNTGSTWQPSANLTQNSAPMVVYGKYQYPQTTTAAVTTYTLGCVSASVRTSDGTKIASGIETLNEPGVPGP